MAVLPRTNITRSSNENKAQGSTSMHGSKPTTNARSVLSHVIKSQGNAMKPASTAQAGSKVSASNKASAASKYSTAHIMATLAARKPRVPLSTVDASKAHMFRDPTPHVARARRSQAAPPAAVVDAQDAAVLPVKSFDAPRALNAQRDSVSSAPKVAVSTTVKAAQAIVSRVVATAEIAMPVPLAGQKRRTNVAEPERVVLAKVSKYSTAPSERREEASTKPAAAVPDSDSTDSQATVVEPEVTAEVKQRKIAKPSRAYSSLRTLAGQAAEAAPVVAAPSVIAPETTVAESTAAETVVDWDDIDAEDGDDPLMVSEYINDIIQYLREREVVTMPNPTYMGKQKGLTWEMRRVLVNWIVQIHYQLRMLPETLFLAVNILDRFLSKRQVAVGKFQLVGLTALMVACKYEETTTPHIEDFVYLAGNSYTVKEILNTEVFMLNVLGFDLSYPNPMTFLRRVSKAEDYNMQTRTVAKYLMEICLVDHRLMQYKPSQISAAGIYLGRRMLESGPWTPNLRHYSGYTEEELEPIVAVMLDHLLATPVDEFVFLKYQHRRYLAVSNFCLEWATYHQNEIRPMTPPTGYFFSSAAEADYEHPRSGAVAHAASAPVATTAYATAAGM